MLLTSLSQDRYTHSISRSCDLPPTGCCRPLQWWGRPPPTECNFAEESRNTGRENIKLIKLMEAVETQVSNSSGRKNVLKPTKKAHRREMFEECSTVTAKRTCVVLLLFLQMQLICRRNCGVCRVLWNSRRLMAVKSTQLLHRSLCIILYTESGFDHVYKLSITKCFSRSEGVLS